MTIAFPRNTLAQAIAAALATAAIGSSRAQDAPALPEPIRVEVTGSRIARIDGETALPVQIIGRDEIERGNWTTAAELVAHVSANLPQQTIATSVGNAFTPGMSSANLRGLGDFNTLILLNGRRLSNYAFMGGTVNLAAIPLAAVDRVEILKDGASSIYGTDAIAGVINFITRKDFTGVSATAQAGVTQHSGGNHSQGTVTAGWGDVTKDRFNAFVTVDWQKDGDLEATQRSFANTGIIPDEGVFYNVGRTTFPANINGNLNPSAASGCAPPGAVAITGLGGCWFDLPASVDLLPQRTLWNVVGRATYEWATGQQLFAEYVFSQNTITSRTQPTGLNAITLGTPLFYPAAGPYYPTDFAAANGLAGPLQINFRTLPLGPTTSEVVTQAQRLVLGGQGTLAGFAYDAAYMHSVDTADASLVSGYLSRPGVVAVMGSGLVNPWGASGDAGMALLQGAQIVGPIRNARGTIDQVDFNASRDVMQLAGAPLAVAFGAEYRWERSSDNPSPIMADIVSFGEVLPQGGSRNVASVFGEISVPLYRGLELGASARYDHYSDFGGTTNPKVAIRWQPVPSLLLRAAWGTGFRAPALADLYTAATVGLVTTGVQDPVRCPVTNLPEDCSGMYPYLFSGNPKLRPETSTQSTAGIVFEPRPGNSLGVQYWRIDKDNLIANYSASMIMNRYDALAATNVVRGPTDPAFPTLPGPIALLLGPYQNIGWLSTQGLDITASVRWSEPGVGTFRASLAGTYIASFDVDSTGGSLEVAGAYGLFPVPRWRHYAELGWQQGPWSATLGQMFQNGYTDQNPNAPDVPPRRVGSYSVWDLQLAYAGFKGWSLAGGIKNLLDTDPPFSNQNATAQVGYDPTAGDPLGRTFYARLTYTFK